MKNRFSLKPLKLALIISFVCHTSFPAFASTDIISVDATAKTISENDHTINVTGDGDLSVEVDSNAAISNNAYTGTTININTNSTTTGVSATGTGAAIDFSGSDSSLSELTVTNGTVTSDYQSSESGTVNLQMTGTPGSAVINVGTALGDDGTGSIKNTGYEGGNAIYSSSNGISLTINNKLKGTISSFSGNAIALSDSGASSSLSLTNDGTISAAVNALSLSGYSEATFINNGTVSGNISVADSSPFTFTNNAGTVTGNITLGSSEDSTATINGGTINGNILMGDAGQSVNILGGAVNGNINGAGSVAISTDFALGGSIGNTSNVGSLDLTNSDLTVGDNYVIKATNININSGSSLTTSSLISGGDDESSYLDTAILLASGTSLVLNSGDDSDASLYGSVNGTADSTGTLTINTSQNSLNSNINIGNTHSLSQVNLGEDVALNLSVNDGALKADTISLDSGSNLTVGTGALVGTISGAGTITFADTTTIAEGTKVGYTSGSDVNSVGQLTINSGATVTANEDIYATNTTITGALNMAASKVLTGTTVTLGGTLTLENGSQVVANINGDSGGDVIINGTVTSNGALGGADAALTSITLSADSTLNLHNNNNSVNAETINLNGGSTLNIGTATVTGTIQGYDEDAVANGNGSVVFNGVTNTLGGNVGTSEGGALSSVTIGSGSTVTAGAYEINASTININGGATVTTSSVLSGGKEDSTYLDAAISLAGGAGLTLNSGSSVYGSVNGTAAATGNLTINTTLNGDINIGNTSSLNQVNLSANSSLDLSGNDGVIKATNIVFGQNSTLTLGEGDFSGKFYSTNNYGTIVFAKDNTIAEGTQIGYVDGDVYGISQLTVNSDATVTANEDIYATNTSIDGALNLAAGKMITGDTVTLAGTLTLETGSQVVADINGSSGGALIVNGTVTSNGALGGASTAALSSITLSADSTLNLNTNNNSANAETINLSSGSTLNIGTATVSGNIQGYAETGSSNHLGTVVFNSNNTLGGHVGNTQGNSVDTVTLSSDVEVAAGSYQINAANINLGNGASLSTSAFISGGDNDDDGATFANAAITLDTDSTLTLNSGSSLFASVNGNTSESSNTTLQINVDLDSYNSNVNIGDTIKLSAVNVADGKTLDLSANDGVLKADLISLGNGSGLTLGNGALAGTITGEDATVSLLKTITIESGTKIGYTSEGTNHYVGQLNIDNAATVTANEDIYATNTSIGGALELAAGKMLTGEAISIAGTLTLQTGSQVVADINGNSDSSANGGTVVINGSVTSNGYLGSSGDYVLHAITLNAGSTLSLNTNNNTANAETINLSSGSTLNIGTGTVTGSIQGYASSGSAEHLGSVTFNGDNTLGGNVGTTDGHSLNSVTISSGVITAGSNQINASTININGTSTLTSSGLISGGGDESSYLNTAISLASGAGLTLNSDSSIYGSIDGASSSNGTLTIGGTLNSTNSLINIGSTNSLSQVTLSSGAALNLSVNDGALKADAISLSSGSNLTVGTGALVGTISGAGTITFADTTSIASGTKVGASGTGNSVGQLTINSGATVTANEDIYATNTTITGALNLAASKMITGTTVTVGGTLTLANGSQVAADINGSSGGAVVVNGTVTSNGALGGGESSSLSSITLSADSTLNLNTHNNSANATTITLNSGSTLNIGTSTVTGSIVGASNGVGTVSIAASATATVDGALGTSESKLALVTINNNAILDVGSSNINVTSISLGSSSLLKVGSGTLSAAISGTSGSVEFTDDNTLTQNISSSSGGINSLIIAADKTLDSGNYSLYANSISLGDGSLLKVGSTSLSSTISGAGDLQFTDNNTLTRNIGNSETGVRSVIIDDSKTLSSGANTIYADTVYVGSGSTLAMQSGSSTGADISGYASGNGSVTTSGTVSLSSIGATNYINNFTVNTGSTATLNGNIGALGDVTINGNAVFANSTTSIAAANFTTTSGSTLNFTINLNSVPSNILDVTGAAMIAANTAINLTVSGTAASGTTTTLIRASEASTYSVDSSKINVNSTSLNIYNGQNYTTSVSGNDLILTVADNVVPTLSSAKDQGTYTAIVGVSNPTGGLAVIQNFLNTNSKSDAEKEAVIKSVSPQTDNASNRTAFNSVSTAGSIISSRLESVRTDAGGTSSGDNGPSFNFNNLNFNQSVMAQTMQPLRDNIIKPSYPLSINLSNDGKATDKSVWIQTFGGNVKQNTTSDGDGYNAVSSGISIGADYKLRSNLIVGINGGVSQSNIKSTVGSKNSSVQSYQFNLYSGYNTKNYFLNTTIGFSLNDYTGRRYISTTGVTAKSDYQGHGYNARAEIGQNYKIKNDLMITPSFMVTAARNEVNDYSETGAGTLNLHIKNSASNFLEGRIGAEVSDIFITKELTQIRPQFSISYGYDFIGDRQETTSNFIGQTTSFTSEGAKVAQGSLKIGTGVAFFTKKNVTFSANYGFERRNSYMANTAWLRAGYKF